MLITLFLLIVLICLFEGLPLTRGKRWKELIVCGTLIGIALIIGIGKGLGLPTPIELLDQWLRPVGKVIFKHF